MLENNSGEDCTSRGEEGEALDPVLLLFKMSTTLAGQLLMKANISKIHIRNRHHWHNARTVGPSHSVDDWSSFVNVFTQ